MGSSKKWTKELIEEKSKSLIGKKMHEVLKTKHKNNNKGSIGSAVETDVFEIDNNSRREPDFVEAGIELKVIPLKKTKKGKLVPKERMVLTMIDYMEDYKYEFQESHLYNKTKMMQIIQYNHNYANKYNSEFIDQYILNFPGEDIEIIQADYNIIINRIKQGAAHLISERDTNYLSACRKGAGGLKDLRDQPFNSIPAPSRAFSLKTKYLRVLNERRVKTNEAIFSLAELKRFNYSFEETMFFKVSAYLGMSKNELISHFQLEEKAKSNQIMNLIISKMFNYQKNISSAPEMQKAGIIPKTIRVIKGKIKESMSFSQIKPKNLNERSWEESELYDKFKNDKFAFFIFEGDTKDSLSFKGFKMWKMPERDVAEYEQVYNQMQIAIKTKGSVWKDEKYKNKFPKEKDNRVGHVRPKAKNSKDTYMLPSGDITPKQCFWLNKKYLLKEIYNLADELKLRVRDKLLSNGNTKIADIVWNGNMKVESDSSHFTYESSLTSCTSIPMDGRNVRAVLMEAADRMVSELRGTE